MFHPCWALALLLAPHLIPQSEPDWLVHPIRARAEVRATRDGLVLDNGLIRRTLRLRPAAATIALDDLRNGAALLRAVSPEARVSLDGEDFAIGGLAGQPDHAYLTDAWLEAMTADPGAFRYVGHEIGRTVAPFPFRRVRPSEGRPWPPPGVSLRLRFAPPAGREDLEGIAVAVHYELYDDIPLMTKWLTVHNGSARQVTVDTFVSEILAVVEHESAVERMSMSPPESLHVETDYAFGAFTVRGAAHHTVHWVPDPRYLTQVNYRRQTPNLLTVHPPQGPDQDIAPGDTFTSFRTFELVHEASDRERRGLALRRMYRTVAPWITENPLMMHMRVARPEAVREAIDQCAEVGFEMVILSFGSGFNIENRKPEYIAAMKELADYAASKGIELGGYSLLSSRKVQPLSDNIVNPETGKPGGQKHGFCPALASAWGQRYFRTLYEFFDATGFDLLEHDGSYPGDVDAAARPPLQKGAADSQWVQWRIITDFYKWCRGRGIYLNVPDYYYLAGSNKCGMGYRETNWSLPRRQQHVHARQNIYDGTWEKTPSMGWMFVPLTQYHGGGAAATMEPLSEHIDDYSLHMASALGMGVQACYRGPRLYDSPAVRDMVKGWVGWYRQYRDILESDLIHGRRADGRDLDWMLHVNPRLQHRGMLVVYNPLDEERRATLTVNLYYTGIERTAKVQAANGSTQELALDRGYRVRLPVTVPAHGMAWYALQSGDAPEGAPKVDWQPQESGVEVSLRGICAVSESVAWAGGENGTCLRTTDGGASWQRIEVPGGGDRSWRDVHAFDAETAVLVNAGQPAVLLRTEDGGVTWREVYRKDDPAAFFDSVDFDAAGQLGVAFSDPVEGRFLVIRSTDGGAAWTELDGLPAPLSREAGFAASGTMVDVQGATLRIATGGGGARVLTSRDGGRSWRASPVPIAKGEPSQGIFSLAFSGFAPRRGVAVGGDYRQEDDPGDAAAWTANGGMSWQPASRMPGGYRSAAAWVPGTEGTYLTVGPSGADVTTDGGESWVPCGETGYHAMAFAAGSTAGWAVGSGGRIARVSVGK